MLNVKIIYKKLPPYLLLAHLALGLAYCLYVVWFTDTLGGDTLEHIHCSWLVYANFVPYKDFFQHHNPLLWYMFAPFVGLHAAGLDDDIITAGVLTAAILVSFLNYLYLYLITSRFLTDKLGGIIAASVAFTPYVVLSVIHFRPDNFMMTAFFAGLYYYFCYLKEQKLWQLSLSFLLFWCSFMFLQKIVFTLLLLGCVTLVLLYLKKIILKDFLYALMLPIALSLFFIAYLSYHDILWVWYQSNFIFNLHIPELFSERRIGMIWPELQLLLAGGVFSLIFCTKGSNIYFKILSAIFVIEALQRLLYFSAFAYYFYLLIYTASILSAVFLSQYIVKYFYWTIYALVVTLFICMYHPKIYEGNIGTRVGRFYEPLNKQIVRRVTPCDYILNGDGTIYNLYNRDPHYYWNLLGQMDVIGAKVGIRPLMDINHVIESKKPKIINVKPYYDKYAKERGIDIIVHKPDMEMINRYYKPYNQNSDLYILKPEFAPIKCDVDYKKKYYYVHD